MCASIQSAAIWTCAASTPNGHGLSLLIFRYQLLTPVIPFRKSEWIGKMTMLTVASIPVLPCLRDQLGHVSRIFHTRACYAAAQSWPWMQHYSSNWLATSSVRRCGFRIAVSENTHPSENESTHVQKIYSRMDHIIAGKERRKTGINPKHFIMNKNSDARDD